MELLMPCVFVLTNALVFQSSFVNGSLKLFFELSSTSDVASVLSSGLSL
uniref:Uncharacterized protein n=1 Tax=Rhizophora mucronata TaxID=61149 RepID=A0A2P2PNZ2_RHIMU